MQTVSKSQDTIKDSLLAQLRLKGAETSHFAALIDDYLYYCQTEKKMQAAVRKNGLLITATSSQGHEYEKENPAIKAAALCNRQKISILKELGLTTQTCQTPDTDEL